MTSPEAGIPEARTSAKKDTPIGWQRLTFTPRRISWASIVGRPGYLIRAQPTLPWQTQWPGWRPVLHCVPVWALPLGWS